MLSPVQLPKNAKECSMLIVFRSNAAADILMLSAHALQVLQAAGKVVCEEGLPERGVFTPGQLEAAMASLDAAMQASPNPAEPSEADIARQPDLAHPVMQPVGLRQRGWPLLDMLRKAQAVGQPVLWEPAAAW